MLKAQHRYSTSTTYLFTLLILSLQWNSLWNVGVEATLPTTSQAKCNVFDPFKVLPDSPNSYQIGGAFPLHKEDCLQLIPSTVQEIVAIQWALSHWNQRQGGGNATRPDGTGNGKGNKLGFFAGDSCSRPKEAVSQTLRFLDSVGYHEPMECLRKNAGGGGAKLDGLHLAGIISPKDQSSAAALASVLKPTNVPIIAYTTASLQEFIEQGVGNVISTAPSLQSYIQTMTRLLQLLKSNLVAIVDNGDVAGTKLSTQVSELLKEEGVHTAELIGYDHPMLNKVLAESEAQIIISLIGSGKGRKELKLDEQLLKTKKFWITLELDSEAEEEVDFLEEKMRELNIGAENVKLQVISIRSKPTHLAEFNNYFLRVLTNNYESFSLLTAYVQQVFNCSIDSKSEDANLSIFNESGFEPCNLESKQLLQMHQPSKRVAPLLKAVYALALATRNIEEDVGLKEMCRDPSSSTKCYDSIVKEVLNLDYRFDHTDIPELMGQALKFHLASSKGNEVDDLSSSNNPVVLLSDMAIEAVLVEREGRDGSMLYKMLEMRTDTVPKFIIHSVPTKLRSTRSVCHPYRPNCGRCEAERGGAALKRMDEDSIFLSNPQQYSLYLAGIFDFHEGPNCEILLRENVALPLAFVHTMWALKSRSTQSNFLSGLDFGAILFDSCSSDRAVMEFLVDSENNCYRFGQAESNWTIVPGSTFGYISTSSIPKSDLLDGMPPPPSVIQRFFASKNSPAPVISIDGDQSNNKGQLFSTMPSHGSLAQALTKYLKKMKWEYVNVVLDKEDPDSISQFHEFELHSKGICIARVNHQASASTSHSPADSTSANVTILFTSAKVAADYLSGRLRQWTIGNNMESSGGVIHVVIGDAYDFYLHDPTNLAHYSGTVSIQPKDVIRKDFTEWLEGITPLTLPETWFWRHVEEYWHCALSLRNKELYQGRMCTGDELLSVHQMGRMTKAGYLSKSVELLLLAADKVHKKLCANQPGICPEFVESGRLHIRNMLADIVVDDEFEVLEFQPIDHHGNFGYKLLANYTSKAGFHQLDTYKSFSNGVQLGVAQPLTSRCQSPLCKCALPVPSAALASTRRMSPTSSDKSEAGEGDEVLHGSYIKKVPAGSNNVEELLVYDADFEPISSDEWPSSETFKYVFLSLTSIFTVLAIATLILVVLKMYFRIVKGNQSLGILLLLGIIMLYATSYTFIADASDVICRTRIMSHAIAHTLCFGVMIVKAIQLQNSETLGVVQGHQLSYFNYWLLMFFILAVQLAICLRWLAEPLSTLKPIVTPSRIRCSYSSSNFFLAEAYTFLLLLLSLLLNALNRNIKRNYKEAKWLLAASLSCTLVLAIWIFFQAFTSPIYINYITILELYLVGTLLLAFLFGPKLYVLLSYEPIIVECTYGTNASSSNPQKNHAFDLFEEEWTPSRATSPAFSNRTASPGVIAKSGSTSSGDSAQHAGSIFQTVLRKKNGVKRSQSENESQISVERLPVTLLGLPGAGGKGKLASPSTSSSSGRH